MFLYEKQIPLDVSPMRIVCFGVTVTSAEHRLPRIADETLFGDKRWKPNLRRSVKGWAIFLSIICISIYHAVLPKNNEEIT